MGLVLDGANRHDVKLVDSTLASLPPAAEAARDAARDAHRAAGGEQGLCLDAGYDSRQVRETLTALGYTAHIRPRGEEVQAKKAGQKARRWVLERTFGWLGKYRRLAGRDFETTPASSEAWIRICMSNLMLRRLARIRKN